MSEDGIKRRGFGSMKLTDPSRLKSISSEGGKGSWKKGVARHFTSAEARTAGKKGVDSRRAKKAR
jgi:hypothetical protein